MKSNKILIAIILLMVTSSFIFGQGRCKVNTCPKNQTGVEKTLKGTIEELNLPIATVKGDDNKNYEVHLGPIKHLYEQQFYFKKGDKVELKGLVYNDNVMVPETVKSNDKTISFKDIKDGNCMGCGNGKGCNDNCGKGKGCNDDCGKGKRGGKHCQ